MKKIMIIGLLLAAIATAKAQTPDTDTHSVRQPDANVETPPSPAAAHDAPAAGDHSAAGGMDRSIIYVGTNEFNLALVREGIRMT